MAAVRNGFSVRAALPKDAPALAELHMRAWEDAYRNILPEEAIRKVNAGHNGVLILERGKVYDKTGKIEAEIWRWIRHIYITAA